MAEHVSEGSNSYKGVPIRQKFNDFLFFCVSDLWKAEGSPTTKRPDKWFARNQFLIEGDFDRLHISPWQAVKGGHAQDQGTWAIQPVTVKYAEFLSSECATWIESVARGSAPLPISDRGAIGLPIRIEDFNGEVRFTSDGRIAVYDGIAFATGHKNPRDVWSDLGETYPEVVAQCDNFQFPGQGQRETPVATLQVFLEILTVLPGRLAAAVRTEAVRTLVRAMNGDVSLVEEILSRINNPEDLENIENAARCKRAQSNPAAFSLPGTIENPLTSITPDIRKGHGWVNREKEMESLLSELAGYRGMFIHRQVPHRPYSQTAKSARSRRIDLILRSDEDPQLIKVYHFEPDYVDEADVADVFLGRSYPEIIYRDQKDKYKSFVVYLVSPGGITDAAVERLKEAQTIIDKKCDGRVKLCAMRLDDLVWNEMYPGIEKQYKDSGGWFGHHHLHKDIRQLCEKLCDRPALPSASVAGIGKRKAIGRHDKEVPGQMSLNLSF